MKKPTYVCGIILKHIKMALSKSQIRYEYQIASHKASTASREELEKMFVQYYIMHSEYLEGLKDACK